MFYTDEELRTLILKDIQNSSEETASFQKPAPIKFLNSNLNASTYEGDSLTELEHFKT